MNQDVVVHLVNIQHVHPAKQLCACLANQTFLKIPNPLPLVPVLPDILSYASLQPVHTCIFELQDNGLQLFLHASPMIL